MASAQFLPALRDRQTHLRLIAEKVMQRVNKGWASVKIYVYPTTVEMKLKPPRNGKKTVYMVQSIVSLEYQ